MTSEPACCIGKANGGTREDTIAAAFPSKLVRYDVIIECEDALDRHSPLPQTPAHVRARH